MGGWLGCGVGPTPPVSCRYTPGATHSNGPDCGSPRLARQGPWPDRLECRPHGCGWPLAPRKFRYQG